MAFIQGTPREQMILYPQMLDEIISPNNVVRNIDLFVQSLNLRTLGFKINQSDNGRPAYQPALLLKIFIYGYLNSIRSSRKLERECHRNVEMMWLTEQLAPDHNTINNFRKDNAQAIKKVFRATVEMAKNYDLIGGKLIAGDSTKLRAQNSKKNNYNQKKIDRHLAYIEEQLEKYNKILDQEEHTEEEKKEAKERIKEQENRKEKYQEIEKNLKESGDKQISVSDPESRQLIIRGNITEVAYSVQCATDAQNNIPIDYEVTNQNDKNAMGGILERSEKVLGNCNFVGLFDKGYHTGAEFKKASAMKIKVLVSIPKIGRSSQAPDPKYNAENFVYDAEKDQYTCPENNVLSSNGKWYTNPSGKFKQYKTKACKDCPVRALCTRAKTNGKIIQRSEHKKYIEANAERLKSKENKALYKRRQAIVEHPFGTIKRSWGFDHVMPKKTIERASADVGFIFIAYNLKRIWNILSNQGIKFEKCLALLKTNLYYLFLALLSPSDFLRTQAILKNSALPTR